MIEYELFDLYIFEILVYVKKSKPLFRYLLFQFFEKWLHNEDYIMGYIMWLTLVAISCNCFCKAPLKGFYLYHNREFLTFSFSHKEALNEIGIWPEFIRDTF